jgi:hypothetical protein
MSDTTQIPANEVKNKNAVQPRPAPLPVKMKDWVRANKSSLTLNDHVEAIHQSLWDTSDEYRAFLEAVWDSDAVEGSLAIDNTMAAMLIREKAAKVDGNPVAHKRLDTIVKSLGVVLRRYQNSRKERRDTVAGTRVESLSNGNGE